jgi:hypothetical protein
MSIPDELRRVLPPDTARTWEEIAPLIPRAAYLVGGTAIAVHLHHRVSRDLDFFYHQGAVDLDTLRETLEETGKFVATKHVSGTLNGLFSETKIQLLHADERHPQRRLEPLTEHSGILVAGLGDLLATKVKVVGDRGELRDFFDLMRIEEQGHRTLEEGLQLYADRYQPRDPASFHHILLALGYLDDAQDDLSLGVSRDVIERWFARRQPELVDRFRMGVPRPRPALDPLDELPPPLADAEPNDPGIDL